MSVSYARTVERGLNRAGKKNRTLGVPFHGDFWGDLYLENLKRCISATLCLMIYQSVLPIGSKAVETAAFLFATIECLLYDD